MAFGTPDSLLLLHRAVQVSILVFLEWPLGRERLLRQRNRFFRSFNPCFSGMAFGTLIGLIRRIVGLLFQSLFFWNGLWDKR